jgi:hypothetical protein
VHDTLFAPQDGCAWGVRPAAIVSNAWRSTRQLGDYLTLLDPFRRLGAPIPPCSPEIRQVLNEVALDERDVDMLIRDGDDFDAITALTFVQIAGRFGWTLGEAHQRFSRLTPIGLELEYPTDIDFPDEIVRWQDLLVLTTYFDGQAPALTGQVTWDYLTKAAEEIFDCPPEDAPTHAPWLRDRLKIYAPLFELQLPEDTE